MCNNEINENEVIMKIMIIYYNNEIMKNDNEIIIWKMK